MAKRKFEPIHPGVVLAEDFLKGMEISQYRLEKGIGVPPRRINEIVQGKRGGVLARYFESAADGGRKGSCGSGGGDTGNFLSRKRGARNLQVLSVGSESRSTGNLLFT